MPHLEEGTIHELLDGELTGAEAAEVAGHVESCAECAARLAEARLFMAEADRLIAGLDAPQPRMAAGAPPAVAAMPDLEIPTERTDRRVLMPAPPPRGWRRRARSRSWAWAAIVVLAAGGGYLAIGRGDGVPDDTLAEATTDAAGPVTSELELPAAAGAARAANAESAGSGGNESAAPELARRSEPSAAQAAAADESARRDEDLARQNRQRESDAREAAARDTREREAREREARRIELASTPAPRPAAAVAKQSVGGAAGAGRAAAPPPDRRVSDVAAMEPGVVRGETAESAPTRSRVADSLIVATPPSVPLAAAARPRPAIDLMAQSQIALRIGLDEAKRELGGNLHVIDGLQPEFVGLVPGRLVPGADTGAYVVRVVYLDDEQRMIFLDQQRIRRRPGSGGPVARLEAREDSSRSQWIAGNVRLSLKGSLSRDSLARLARRVR